MEESTKDDKTIEAVIFDVGGVLLRTVDHAPRRAWEERLGLAAGDAEYLVYNSPAGRAAQRGEVTEDEHWRRVARELDIDLATARRFQAEFWSGDRLDSELIALIRRLRTAYKTAIISNAFDGLRRVLEDKYKIADAFDLIVISAEAKVMKPNPAIYLNTLEAMDCRPEQAIFVDDLPVNVQGARDLGMHAIHFTPEIEIGAALAALGVRL